MTSALLQQNPATAIDNGDLEPVACLDPQSRSGLKLRARSFLGPVGT
jgi:hypothetical protein